MTFSRLPSASAAWRTAMLLALACAVSGCVSDGQGPAAQGSVASAPGGATVAFESIDGPPPQVFDRMVDVLDSETKLRKVAVVSREAPAAYRVRSYLAAQTVRGRTSIDWVWDVYDRNQQRTLRLSGSEPVGQAAGRDAWAAADDVTLRRIAQAGLSGLSAVAGGAAPAEAPAAAPSSPQATGPAVASTASPPPASPPPRDVALSFASR